MPIWITQALKLFQQIEPREVYSTAEREAGIPIPARMATYGESGDHPRRAGRLRRATARCGTRCVVRQLNNMVPGSEVGRCDASLWTLANIELLMTANRLFTFYRATLCVSAVFAVARCLSVRHVRTFYTDG